MADKSDKLSDSDREAIRFPLQHGGEFDAMLAVRRIRPGISVEEAREMVRAVALDQA